MSELIWKIKSLFRKVVPVVLIVGLCYGGFTAYKKGLLGRKITYQISSWTRAIPFFGSKFSVKNFIPTTSGRTSSVAVVRNRKHGRGHHFKKHRSHRSRRHHSRR